MGFGSVEFRSSKEACAKCLGQGPRLAPKERARTWGTSALAYLHSQIDFPESTSIEAAQFFVN